MNKIDRNTFNIGDTGVTRDGRKFTIVDKEDDDIPYYVQIDGDGYNSWRYADGRAYSTRETGADLMPPAVNPVFAVGSTGKTRGGRSYRVIAVDAKDDRYPVVALLEANGKETATTYTSGGCFYEDGAKDSMDLMPPSRTVYVNLYADGRARHYYSEAQARACAQTPPMRSALATAVPLEIPA